VQRRPSAFFTPRPSRAGGKLTESYRLAAVYAGRSLNGAKPADLAVQQVTKVELTSMSGQPRRWASCFREHAGAGRSHPRTRGRTHLGIRHAPRAQHACAVAISRVSDLMEHQGMRAEQYRKHCPLLSRSRLGHFWVTALEIVHEAVLPTPAADFDRASETSVIKGDAAVSPGEFRDLLPPAHVVPTTPVCKDDSRAIAMHFVIQADAIDGNAGHRPLTWLQPTGLPGPRRASE